MSAHYDSRGVFIETWVLDAVDCDYPAALLLSQILWWHQPAKDGEPRARYERDGNVWLLRSDEEWWDDCRLTVKQMRRVRGVLVSLGLIESRRFKRAGAPVSAYRPLFENVRAARERTAPQREVPPEGHIPTSAPPGSDATALPAAVAKEETPEENPSQTSDVSPEVKVIIEQLARKVTAHSGHRPKTAAWAKPIDLLLRRGHPDWADPAPVPPREVIEMIELVFSAGAVKSGSSNFCWADQVRSGEALRRHWVKLLAWKERPSRPIGNTDAVDEVFAAYESAGRAPGETLGL